MNVYYVKLDYAMGVESDLGVKSFGPELESKPPSKGSTTMGTTHRSHIKVRHKWTEI